MKGPLYVATVSKVYSQALRYYKKHGHFLSEQMMEWEEELKKFPHRDYAPNNLINPAGAESVFHQREEAKNTQFDFIGEVRSVENGFAFIQVKNAFNKGDRIETLSPKLASKSMVIESIFDLAGSELERTKPSTLVKLRTHRLEVGSLLRRERL